MEENDEVIDARILVIGAFSALLNYGAQGFPAKPMVCKDNCDHGFTHGHKTRQQARIVSSFRADRRRLTISRDGWLLSGKAAGRLDGGPQHNWHPGTDAAQHSAVAVGTRQYSGPGL